MNINDEKIDFVLPWVDGSDKKWQKKKDSYSPISDDDSNSSKRFRDFETLKYVLRSIEKNCPWYNKIYLITEGHYPEWLNINHDKIILITHEELYFDKTHLPVFNSSSIEMNLANIKGLSEKFVYLNDDMIIFNKLEQSRFFIDNKPVDFLSHGWIKRGKLFHKLRGMTVWLYSLNNNLSLINRELRPFQFSKESLYHSSYDIKTKISNFLLKHVYKKYIWLDHWHHPQPYLRKTLLDVYSTFTREMMESSKNRFRANNDLTQYLYRYWHLTLNEFSPYQHNDGYDANIFDMKSLYKSINKLKKNKNINFVGFNDHIRKLEDFELIKHNLINFLENIFSEKASFEL